MSVSNACNFFFRADETEAILSERDGVRRARLLIKAARKVVGEGESVFVSPQDIVDVSAQHGEEMSEEREERREEREDRAERRDQWKRRVFAVTGATSLFCYIFTLLMHAPTQGNSKLNLAFALTLFNTRPALQVPEPSDTLTGNYKKKSAKDETSTLEGIWIIGDNLGVYSSGKVTWNHSENYVKIVQDNNSKQTIKLSTTDVQVVATSIWDLGLSVSKSSYKLNNSIIRTVYFLGFDSDEKEKSLKEFLSTCRTYTSSRKVEDEGGAAASKS